MDFSKILTDAIPRAIVFRADLPFVRCLYCDSAGASVPPTRVWVLCLSAGAFHLICRICHEVRTKPLDLA